MPSTTSTEEALLCRFKGLVKVPAHIDRLRQTWERLREALHTDIMKLLSADSVGVNYAIRFEHALLSQIAGAAPEMSAAPLQMLPYNALSNIDQFADTCQVLGNRLAHMGKLAESVTGLLQDSMTLPMGWMKLCWQEDWTRDPAGGRHFDQMDQLVARRAVLQMEIASAPDDEVRRAMLADTEDAIRAVQLSVLQSSLDAAPPMPPVVTTTGEVKRDPRFAQLEKLNAGEMLDVATVPHYKGFTFDAVEPEDVFWDWNIRRPEYLTECDWMAHRVQMSRDQVISKFGLTAEQAEHLSGDGRARDRHGVTRSTGDTMRRDDADTPYEMDKITVWELWYKPTRTVYVWSEGYPAFLDRYQPPITSARWFPFFMLQWNRVTGRMIGVSDFELLLPLQEEYNELRTHDREARNAAYPRYVVQAGMFDPVELDRIRLAMPFDIVEVSAVGAVKDGIHELQPVKYDPDRYGIGLQRVRLDMEAMMGLPAAGLGSTGAAGLATEVAFAGQQLKLQNDRRDTVISTFLSDIFTAMLEIAFQAMEPSEITALVGEGAILPPDPSRYLNSLKISASMRGPPDAKEVVGFITQLVNVGAALGLTLNGPSLIQQLLDSSQLRLDLDKVVLANPATPAMPVGGQQQSVSPVGATPTGDKMPTMESIPGPRPLEHTQQGMTS